MSRISREFPVGLVGLSALVCLLLHVHGSGVIQPLALAEETQVRETEETPPEQGQVTERGVDVRDHRGMRPTAPGTPPPPPSPSPSKQPDVRDHRGMAPVLPKTPPPPLTPIPPASVGPTVDTNSCVPDVRAAFFQVRTHGDKLGFYHRQSPGAYDEPGFSQQQGLHFGGSHYQGIQRLRGGNFLAVTGSTSKAAELLIVELRSRSGTGRLRSNRLSSNAPPGSDEVVTVKAIHDDLKHAGGFQIIGDYLAVGVEKGNESLLVFYSLQNPRVPVKLPYEIVRKPEGQLPFDATPDQIAEYKRPAGAVGVVKRPDGRYLLVVGRKDSNILDFYLSATSSLRDPRFESLTTWRERELRSEAGMDREFGNYQNLNLLRQCDGQIFLVGLHNNTAGLNVIHIGQDWADLFRLDLFVGGQVNITKIANRHLYCKDMCNLDAGGGIYVAPNGELFVYGIEHWRHNGMARFNEFRPVPPQVNPPLTDITKAWVELYDDDGFRDRSLMIDYVDYGLRNYADYDQVEGFEDKTSAARWLLPAGWQYLLFQHKNFKGKMLPLAGNGNVQAIADFNKIGWNDRVSSSQFAKRKITRITEAWIELFDDKGFTDRRLTLRGRVEPIEDYKNLTVEEQLGFGDKVSSARYQIPRGLVYRLYQNDRYGGQFIDLIGTGQVEEISDLAQLDFNDRTSSSKYVP